MNDVRKLVTVKDFKALIETIDTKEAFFQK